VASNLVVVRTVEPSGVRLRVAGEIDCATAAAFLDRLRAAIDATDAPIVVDLDRVTFMDSTGLDTLVVARKSAGRRIRVGEMHPAVQRILRITALLDELTGPPSQDRDGQDR
jgi:anti-anti-sigma factor